MSKFEMSEGLLIMSYLMEHQLMYVLSSQQTTPDTHVVGRCLTLRPEVWKHHRCHSMVIAPSPGRMLSRVQQETYPASTACTGKLHCFQDPQCDHVLDRHNQRATKAGRLRLNRAS
jgi:hypothetical protein